ncbi:hypothetical protein D3C85_1921660 [compost metagenome]
MRVDPVADFEARDAVTDRDHGAGCIANRDQEFGHLMRLIDAINDRLVAKVE